MIAAGNWSGIVLGMLVWGSLVGFFFLRRRRKVVPGSARVAVAAAGFGLALTFAAAAAAVNDRSNAPYLLIAAGALFLVAATVSWRDRRRGPQAP